MATKKGKGRILIRLVNKETGSFYTTTINKRNAEAGSGKFKIKKYDKKLRRHVVFTEDKIK